MILFQNVGMPMDQNSGRLNFGKVKVQFLFVLDYVTSQQYKHLTCICSSVSLAVIIIERLSSILDTQNNVSLNVLCLFSQFFISVIHYLSNVQCLHNLLGSLFIHILSGNAMIVYIADWPRVWKMSWKWLIYIWNSALGSRDLL